MLRAERQVARAADRTPARGPVDDREGHVEPRVGPFERLLEPAVEALPIGGLVDWEPAPDGRVLRGLPEGVLVLGPERLDDDEPALEPRRGPRPGHYASRM